jgi:uncharacterized RDD family membrane protein YckC
MTSATASDPIRHDAYDDELMTGEAVALDLRPTAFVLAAAGAAIDFIVYLGGGILLLTYVILPPLAGLVGDDSAANAALTLAGSVVMLVVIPVAVELVSHGKSLGRLAVGARIVRDDGGAIGFRHAFIRGLTSVIEIYATLGGLAALIGLLNGRSKRLGDLIAGTYSQYERVSREVPPTFGVPVELQAWAVTADVARMPERLARRIGQFLRQAAVLSPSTRDRLSRQLAIEASTWVSPVPRTDAELFLAAVVTLRREREYAALLNERERLARLGTTLGGLPHGFPERP